MESTGHCSIEGVQLRGLVPNKKKPYQKLLPVRDAHYLVLFLQHLSTVKLLNNYIQQQKSSILKGITTNNCSCINITINDHTH